MKEIRIENGSMYFERLIQVTKNPKGEQRPPKAALKGVVQKWPAVKVCLFVTEVSTRQSLASLTAPGIRLAKEAWSIPYVTGS